MQTTPRERLIRTAIDLARKRGIEGSGIADILETSGTARRSLYQHFPGGKSELFAASTRRAGAWIEKALHQQAEDRSAADLISELFEATEANLVANGYDSGCPIAAAAVAVPEDAAIREAAAEAFASWTREIARRLEAEGRSGPDAESLANFIVSAIEGALLQARAARTTDPLEQARRYVGSLVAAQ